MQEFLKSSQTTPQQEFDIISSVMRTLPVTLCLLDKDRNIIRAYNVMEQFKSSYTEESLEGLNLNALLLAKANVYNDFLTQYNKVADTVLESGTPYSFECIVANQYYIIEVSRLKDSFILLSVRNRYDAIFQQLERERMNRDELSAALVVSGLSSWTYDVATNRVSSVQGNDMIGTDIEFDALVEKIAPEHKALFLGMYDKLLNQGSKHENITVQIQDEHGKFVWATVHAVPKFYTTDGKVAAIVGSQQDVTQNVFYETSRNELIKQNSLILNNTNFGIVYIDANYKVLWENVSTVFKGWEYAEHYKKGHFCYENFSDRGVCEQCAVREVLQTKKVSSHTYPIGGDREVEIIGSPVINENGEFEGVVLRIIDVTENRAYIRQIEASQKKIAASNKLLQTIINNMPCSMFIKDVADNFRYVMVNKNFCNTLTLPVGCFEGRFDSDIFPEEQAAKFREDDLRTISMGVTQIMSEEATFVNGITKYWYTMKTIMYDESENKTFLIGIALDITTQKETMAKYEKSEKEATAISKILKSIIDFMPSSLVIKDINNDMKYFMVNKLYCEHLGRKEEELLGKSDKDIFSEERANTYLQEDIQVAQNGLTISKARPMTIDGKDKVWQISKTRLTDLPNDEKLLICLGLDITDMVNEQKQVAYSKLLLELTFDAGGLIPWEWDLEKDTVYSNSENSVLYRQDIPREEYIDQNIHPSCRKEFREICAACLNGSENTISHRMKMIRGEDVLWIHMIGRKIIDPISGVPKMIGIDRFINEEIKKERDLIEAKAKAEQSDSLKSAFLANMSHEIRTPLNALVGFSHMLIDATDQDKETYLAIIDNNSEILLNLINDVLNLSKIEAGYMEYVNTEFDLSQLFKEHEVSIKPRIKHGVKLINAATSEVCIVNLDKFKVSQIITNFLTNAAKFTEEGYIKMGYEIENGGVKLYVQDTGCGISEENKGKVFERFEKFNTFIQGTGLGTSICKAIVDAYSGKIGLESELGKGSLFWAWLPTEISGGANNNTDSSAADSSAADSNAADSSTDEKFAKCQSCFKQLKEGQKARILIAEDDNFNARLMFAILGDYDVTRVENGQEAVEKACAECFDFILMDIRMPIMDGLEATREIRKFNPNIPIIAVTANAFDTDCQAALDAGCTHFVSKPINRKKLLELLN